MTVSTKVTSMVAFGAVFVITTVALRLPAAEYLTAEEASRIKGMGCYGNKDIPCTDGDGDDCDETQCKNGACPAGSKERDPNTKSVAWYKDYGPTGYGYLSSLYDLDDIDCGTIQDCAADCKPGMDGNDYCNGAAGKSAPWMVPQKRPTGAECGKS